MQSQHEHQKGTARSIIRFTELRIVRFTTLRFCAYLLIPYFGLTAPAQILETSVKRFERDGLAFDYTENWVIQPPNNLYS
jgi:hypothetical protein